MTALSASLSSLQLQLGFRRVISVIYFFSSIFDIFFLVFIDLVLLGKKFILTVSVLVWNNSSAEILSNSCSNLTLESLFLLYQFPPGLKSQDYKIPLGLDTYETSVATPLMPQSYILKDFHSLTVLFMCPSAC